MATTPKIKFVKLSSYAYSPTRRSTWAAGLDVYSPEDIVIPARHNEGVKIDLVLEIPQGSYGRIAAKQLHLERGLHVGGGAVDSDFRGNVIGILFNLSEREVTILRGEAVAQIIISEITQPTVEQVPELNSTERGERGFGSSGLT